MNLLTVSVLFVSAFFLVSATEVIEDKLTKEQVEECGECCKIDYTDCSSGSTMGKVVKKLYNWIDPYIMKPEWLPDWNPVKDDNKDKVVVCYFTNWAWYRKGVGKFEPENIDPKLCTHIIYAFASLNATTNGDIAVYDSWADIDNHFYEKVTALRSQGVKVLIAIGGWNDSTDKWNTLMASEELRKKFVESVLAFLKLYNFDGLDMDYEYPGCPQGVRSAESQTNAKNFNLLIQELRKAFGSNYLLTLATSAGKSTLQECYYDVPSLLENFDLISIMGYDYKSYLDGEVGANAPFCRTGESWGVYDTLVYYTEVIKCSAKKIVLGVPFYGKTFTLADKDNHKWGAAVTGAGAAGPFTAEKGFLAYYEICTKIAEGWTEEFNPVNSSCAYKGDQFVSFDNIKALERKICLIQKFGLRGCMIWTLDYDDFAGKSCNCGTYPRLKKINNMLRGTNYDVPCAK